MREIAPDSVWKFPPVVAIGGFLGLPLYGSRQRSGWVGPVVRRTQKTNLYRKLETP
jgi:hypothetical protein